MSDPPLHKRFADMPRRALLLGAPFALGGAPRDPAMISIDAAAGRCIVPASLDAHPARLLLDTGSERSIVTHEAALRLGLRPDRWVATTMRGAGGRLERFANIDLARARAGDVALFQNAPGGGLSLAVTTADLGDADGLLGGDVLRHYTIDLDMRRGRLALRTAAPAIKPHGAVPLQWLRRNLLLAPVRLDGHDLVALLDTGATTSLLNARGLFRMALTPSQTAHDPPVGVRAIGGTSAARLHRFADLRIGALTVAAPAVLIAPVAEPAYDIVLGADILGRQRIILSYAALLLQFVPGDA
jgi:predicted aspartyl protease